MKNVLKLTLAAALMVAAMPAMAQKFGYVDTRAVVFALPEVESIKSNLEKLSNELILQIEEMQVEGNRKLDEYQKTEATLSDAMKRLKQEEIENIGRRIEERQEAAQTELAQKEEELMKPLIDKARAAIESVMKAQGLAGVFDAQVLVCQDNTQMVDVTPLAKKQLGL
jgi:outer membrane protein